MSADAPDLTRKRFKQFRAFSFPVLSDHGHLIATKYRTYIPNPKPGEDGDMVHGTFVIGRNGRILWANRGDEPFNENRTLLIELVRAGRHVPSGN